MEIDGLEAPVRTAATSAIVYNDEPVSRNQ